NSTRPIRTEPDTERTGFFWDSRESKGIEESPLTLVRASIETRRMSAQTLAEPADRAAVRPIPRDWSRVAGRSGLALVALGLVRAYPDAIGLFDYLRDHVREVFSAPERLDLTEFPGALWAIWPILIGLALTVGRSPRLFKGAML